MAPRRGCWEGHRFFSSARSSLLWKLSNVKQSDGALHADGPEASDP